LVVNELLAKIVINCIILPCFLASRFSFQERSPKNNNTAKVIYVTKNYSTQNTFRLDELLVVDHG